MNKIIKKKFKLPISEMVGVPSKIELNVMKYKVKELVKTCEGYPSQWEVKLEDGKMIYIRYRWGNLDVRISAQPTNNIDDAVRGKSIYRKNIGGVYDGVMEDSQMLSLLEDIIEFKS